MSINPNALLADLMSAHGVRSELHDDGVLFPDHGKRGYARLFEREQGGQLDVGIEIAPGWLLLESFAGIGGDRGEALGDAFRAFAQGALHVILSAFFAGGGDGQVTREQWIIAGTPRLVTLGNVMFRGRQQVDPLAWFPQFEAALKASALPEGTHWLRLYLARQGSGAMTSEALLDNEIWPDMQQAMAHFAWPAAGDFYSIRLFLVVQGGVGLAEACTVIGRNGDPGAVEELVAMGATPRHATLLYSLVTLAFGRRLMTGLNVVFPDKFLLRTPGGRQELRLLAGEPLFREAAALAQSRRQLSRDQFAAIALQSPEVMAVNDALNNGSSEAGLMLSAPLIRLPA